MRCADPSAGEAMVAAINAAKPDGDTVGGVVEVRVTGVPLGLGSHVHWDRKLDGRIAQAICSINASKASVSAPASKAPGCAVRRSTTSFSRRPVATGFPGATPPTTTAASKAAQAPARKSSSAGLSSLSRHSPIPSRRWTSIPARRCSLTTSAATSASCPPLGGRRGDGRNRARGCLAGEVRRGFPRRNACQVRALPREPGPSRPPRLGRALVPVTAKRIFLVGLSGAGKSTVGRLLATRLGWDFADSDREVERRPAEEHRGDFQATKAKPGFANCEAASARPAMRPRTNRRRHRRRRAHTRRRPRAIAAASPSGSPSRPESAAARLAS